MLHFSPDHNRGFTLMEIIIVIGILGLLLTVGLASYQGSQRAARDSRRKVDLEIIAQALEIYKSDNGRYPGEIGCDSSRGSCGGCPCRGSTWAGRITTALEPNYIRDLPVDQRNNSTNYYSYEPVCSATQTVCGTSRACSSSCCAYELRVTLEAGTTQTVCNP